MIWMFLVGFVVGAICCLGTLFTMAVISINKKKKQFEKLKGGAK